MPRVHVLGGGRWQVPTVLLAKSLGYEVFVTDMYAERPAFAIADDYEVIDIGDIEGTLRAARRWDVDGVVCDTTDIGVVTAAHVAAELGLVGISTHVAVRFTNKFFMRQLTAAAGLAAPKFRFIKSLADLVAAVADLGFPVVVKPADSQGSRGFSKVNQPSELAVAYRKALDSSRAQAVIVETVLAGQEIAVESLCSEGSVYVLAVSEKEHYGRAAHMDQRVTFPADLSTKLLEIVAQVNSAVIRALGLQTGITHAEYFVDGESVTLVEIAARGAGSGVFSDIVPYVSGVNVPELYLRYIMGEGMPTALSPTNMNRAVNLEFLDLPAGKVRSISGIDDVLRVPGVRQLVLDVQSGDEILPPDDCTTRPGLIIVFGHSRADVLARTAEARSKLLVEIETA